MSVRILTSINIIQVYADSNITGFTASNDNHIGIERPQRRLAGVRPWNQFCIESLTVTQASLSRFICRTEVARYIFAQ